MPSFKKSGLNFIGNIEGSDIPLGRANVVICDGFVGDILVKFCESLGETVVGWLQNKLEDKLPKAELSPSPKALPGRSDRER